MVSVSSVLYFLLAISFLTNGNTLIGFLCLLLTLVFVPKIRKALFEKINKPDPSLLQRFGASTILVMSLSVLLSMLNPDHVMNDQTQRKEAINSPVKPTQTKEPIAKPSPKIEPSKAAVKAKKMPPPAAPPKVFHQPPNTVSAEDKKKQIFYEYGLLTRSSMVRTNRKYPLADPNFAELYDGEMRVREKLDEETIMKKHNLTKAQFDEIFGNGYAYNWPGKELFAPPADFF